MKLSKQAYIILNDWTKMLGACEIKVIRYREMNFFIFLFQARTKSHLLCNLEIPENEVIEFDIDTEDDSYINVKDIEYVH